MSCCAGVATSCLERVPAAALAYTSPLPSHTSPEPRRPSTRSLAAHSAAALHPGAHAVPWHAPRAARICRLCARRAGEAAARRQLHQGQPLGRLPRAFLLPPHAGPTGPPVPGLCRVQAAFFLVPHKAWPPKPASCGLQLGARQSMAGQLASVALAGAPTHLRRVLLAGCLWQELGAAFIREQHALWGREEGGGPSYYTADVFNEMRPSSADPAYLASVSAAVFKASRERPHAVPHWQQSGRAAAAALEGQLVRPTYLLMKPRPPTCTVGHGCCGPQRNMDHAGLALFLGS